MTKEDQAPADTGADQQGRPPATALARALRQIAKKKRLSSLDVPIVEDAADEIDALDQQFHLLKPNGTYNWKCRAEKAEAEVEHLKAERDKDRSAYLGALGHAIPCGHDGKLSDGTVPQNPIVDAVVKLRAEPAERDRDHFAKSLALLAREIDHLKREAQGGIAPRVLELAQQGAAAEHNYHTEGVETLESAGHKGAFKTCPHPDCQAVRSVEKEP